MFKASVQIKIIMSLIQGKGEKLSLKGNKIKIFNNELNFNMSVIFSATFN